MKKTIIVLMIAILVLTTFISCGASWEQTKKSWKSDLGGGLVRKIVVSNQITGEVVWEHEGKSYISDGSTAGDVTIVFYDEFGNSKKADFIGNFYGVSSVEI